MRARYRADCRVNGPSLDCWVVRRRIHSIVCLAAIVLVAGCSSTQKEADNTSSSAPPPVEAQADAAGETTSPAPDVAAAPVPDEDGYITEFGTPTIGSPLATSQPAALRRLDVVGKDDSIAVDAMVGHVNGKPIYANTVFEPMVQELTTRGKQVPRDRFRNEATAIISRRLNGMVIEALILGQAERNLKQQEEYGLRVILKKQREELIRKLGMGAESVADSRLQQSEGLTLDEKVDEIRAEALVKKYTREKIIPQINVSRRDIKRYYKRHYDEFNPPPGRKIHMIRTRDISKGARIDKMLAEGKPFLEIAGDSNLNEKDPDKQGLFFENIQDEKIFDNAKLNDPTLKLQADQHTERIKLGSSYYWIYVATISTGEVKPLKEVQADVEARLRIMQYNQLTGEYHRELFETGSYDPLDDMVDRLVEVAMNRFAMPR